MGGCVEKRLGHTRRCARHEGLRVGDERPKSIVIIRYAVDDWTKACEDPSGLWKETAGDDRGGRRRRQSPTPAVRAPARTAATARPAPWHSSVESEPTPMKRKPSARARSARAASAIKSPAAFPATVAASTT